MELYTDEYFDKFETLVSDESFAEEAKKAASPEELARLFAEHGLETEDEMVHAMFDKMIRIESGEELTAEELELVAGGKINKLRLFCSCAATAAVMLGASTCNPVGFALGVAAAGKIMVWGAKKDLGMK